MLRLKFIHVSKRGPWMIVTYKDANRAEAYVSGAKKSTGLGKYTWWPFYQFEKGHGCGAI